MAKKQIDIETERLLLRRWQENDLNPFICMNKDPEVMSYFLNTLSIEQTLAFHERIQKEFSEYGYGLYAAEEKSGGDFIGFIGFHHADFKADFCPCLEIGWRLDKKYWGNGYATEGAEACLKHGFLNLKLPEIYSFTSVENKASQRIMQKIGLNIKQYFDHPNIPVGHFLRPHVCYYIKDSIDSI